LNREERTKTIERFATRLKFPQLFVLFVVLFLVDLLIADPIPFIDEALFALLAVLFGMWRKRRGPDSQDLTSSSS
jgi:hypothetical protein